MFGMGTGVTLDVIDTRYGISLEILIWNFTKKFRLKDSPFLSKRLVPSKPHIGEKVLVGVKYSDQALDLLV